MRTVVPSSDKPDKVGVVELDGERGALATITGVAGGCAKTVQLLKDPKRRVNRGHGIEGVVLRMGMVLPPKHGYRQGMVQVTFVPTHVQQGIRNFREVWSMETTKPRTVPGPRPWAHV